MLQIKHKYYILYTLLIVTAITNLQCTSKNEVSVMTFNIRYDNPNDGKNSWTNANRKEKAITTIKKYKPAVLGLQEALHHQVIDVANELKNYTWVGVGRDDGKTKGEYVPIFYDKNRFELLNSGYFWLSETPTIPSLGWDATCCNRITTWVYLKENNNLFYVFNTHYDHEGIVAQQESSKLLIRNIKTITKGKPTVILGDFNSLPNSKAIQLLNNEFIDTYTVDTSNHKSTFNGFKSETLPNKRIDYIFVSKNITIRNNNIIVDKIGNLFPSDHLPVLSIISF